MCVLIYTMSRCQHQEFQNLSECSAARGTPGVDRKSLTLDKTLFLFDTSGRYKQVGTEGGTDRGQDSAGIKPCRKVKAVRPLSTLCAPCTKLAEQAARLGPVDMPVSSLSSGSSGYSTGSSVGTFPRGGSSFS